MQHSSVVGGSTAKRVINCPASVGLLAKMPPRPSSADADKGTLLHTVIALHLEGHGEFKDFLGMKYENITLTQEMIDESGYTVEELLAFHNGDQPLYIKAGE